MLPVDPQYCTYSTYKYVRGQKNPEDLSLYRVTLVLCSLVPSFIFWVLTPEPFPLPSNCRFPLPITQPYHPTYSTFRPTLP